MSPDALRAAAVRHATLRWVGVGLFFCAVPVFLLAVGEAVALGAPSRVLLGLFGLGMSLGAFGVNNDVVLHALHHLASGRAALPPGLDAEYAHERKTRRARLEAAHSHPMMGYALPIVAIASIAWTAWRALGSLGLVGAAG